MNKRLLVILLVLILMSFSSCANGTNIEDSKGIEIIGSEVEQLDIELSKMNEKIEDISLENSKLKNENEYLKDIVYNLQDDVDAMADKKNDSEKELHNMSYNIGLIDSNIRVLFELNSPDEYYYLDYRIEDRLEDVEDFESLMALYSYRLDGIYSDMFSGCLGQVYRETEFSIFVDGISIYNDAIIDDLSGYLVYDLGFKEGIIKLESDISGLDESYDNNYFISRVEHYIELRFGDS